MPARDARTHSVVARIWHEGRRPLGRSWPGSGGGRNRRGQRRPANRNGAADSGPVTHAGAWCQTGKGCPAQVPRTRSCPQGLGTRGAVALFRGQQHPGRRSSGNPRRGGQTPTRHSLTGSRSRAGRCKAAKRRCCGGPQPGERLSRCVATLGGRLPVGRPIRARHHR